jgi:hypothetical protein
LKKSFLQSENPPGFYPAPAPASAPTGLREASRNFEHYFEKFRFLPEKTKKIIKKQRNKKKQRKKTLNNKKPKHYKDTQNKNEKQKNRKNKFGKKPNK